MRITLEIRIENAASVRVAERANFTQCDTIYGAPADGCGVDEDTVDVMIFERLVLNS